MSPVLSSSLAAGDGDVCMAPFTTAMVDGVDMAAYELAEGRAGRVVEQAGGRGRVMKEWKWKSRSREVGRSLLKHAT